MMPPRRSVQRAGGRGFTLLEVLVAVSILGLGLTVILSSQAGLFTSSQRGENLSLATHLARCRMNETEVELLKLGYPLTDTKSDEGTCCEEESQLFFRCTRKIERIQLPQPAGFNLDGGVREGGAPSGLNGDGGSSLGNPDGGTPSLTGPLSSLAQGGSPLGALGSLSAGGLGPLGALASISQTGGQAIGGSSIGSFTSFMGSSSGVSGLVPVLMGLVYPDLKKMLEASIRKVTITVKWREGSHDRDLSVTQFVTNPLQGGIDPNAAKGLQALDALTGGAAAGSTTQTGVGTTPSSPFGASPFGGLPR